MRWSFFTEKYLDLTKYVGELEQRLQECRQLLETTRELETSIRACRHEMQMLFAEVEMAMQAVGFVNTQLRRLPLTPTEPPPVPMGFTSLDRQRESV